MEKYSSILVPVHFRSLSDTEITVAPDSKEAIEQAFALAGKLGSSITFAHVFAGESRPGESDDGHLPRIRQTLADMVREAHSHGVVAAWEFLFGQPTAEIISLAESEPFDLVLLGTRQRSGHGRAPVGSTAAAILAQCPVPTWVAKHQAQGHRGLVVATDLTPESDPALEHGVCLARWLGVDLHIVHACERVVPASVEATESELRRRRAHLEVQMAQLHGRVDPIPNFASHVELGSPEAVIWSTARRENADVVVIGLRDHSATERLLRANTAEHVLPELPCSLLTVPARHASA